MKLTATMLALLVAAPSAALATPSFTLRLAEGFVVLFKDGEPASGPVTTRLGLAIGGPIGTRFGWSMEAGLLTPNDKFQPAPRVLPGISLKATTSLGVAIAVCYQWNPPYGDKPDSHFIGVAAAVSYRVGRVSIGLALGPGKTLGGLWSLLIQPSIGYTF